MESAVTFSTARELFKSQEPYYLSIGMTHEAYWEGSPELAQCALKAFNIKQKREFESANFKAWLDGYYNFQAVYAAVSYALDGKAAKKLDINYFEKPCDIPYDEEDVKRLEEQKVKEAREAAKAWMKNVSVMTNEKFKGGGNNGR